MVLLTLQDVKTFSQISQKPIDGFGRKEGRLDLVVGIIINFCRGVAWKRTPGCSGVGGDMRSPRAFQSLFVFMCGLEIPQPCNRPSTEKYYCNPQCLCWTDKSHIQFWIRSSQAAKIFDQFVFLYQFDVGSCLNPSVSHGVWFPCVSFDYLPDFDCLLYDSCRAQPLL